MCLLSVLRILGFTVLRKDCAHGYGKAILNSLEEKALEFGFKVLRLDTGAHNVAAQHMYRHAGYEERGYYSSTPYGRAAKDTSEDGKIYYANKIYFEKKL